VRVEVSAEMLAPADRVWRELLRTLERGGLTAGQVDERDLRLEVRQAGGLVRRVSVEQTLGPRSRCTERIEVPGGALAPVGWLRAQAGARARLARLRRAARTL